MELSDTPAPPAFKTVAAEHETICDRKSYILHVNTVHLTFSVTGISYKSSILKYMHTPYATIFEDQQ